MILLLVAILSITVIGKYASAPENHQKTIASLDEKKQTVMELTAASTVTSALITLLPGDTATPIAEKMADVSGYLLVVPLRYLSGKISRDDYRLCGIYLPDSDCLWLVDIQSDLCKCHGTKTGSKVGGVWLGDLPRGACQCEDIRPHRRHLSGPIEATIEDARNTQNILENSGVVDDTNATETTGIGTTEVPGTVTGNVQEKENNNSGSVSNIFDWAKMPFPALKIQWQMLWKM